MTVQTARPAGWSSPVLSPEVLRLLARAEGELVAAALSGPPWERYLHAHLAALRAAAAVLAVRGTPRGRGAPRDVWGLAGRVAPELMGGWSYFAGGAGLRLAIEAGRTDRVGDERADEAVGCAEQTVAAVRALVGLDVSGEVGVLAS
jgi:hypothetical protein